MNDNSHSFVTESESMVAPPIDSRFAHRDYITRPDAPATHAQIGRAHV